MSQFENSEVMVKYAEIMLKHSAPPGKVPTSRPPPDPEITPPNKHAPEGGGMMEGMGTMVATMVGFEAASMAGRALFGGGAAAAVGGAGAGAAVGGGAAAAGGGLAAAAWPVTAIVGAVAAVGGLAYGIYWWVERTDDNVADLIDRIEDLDYEGTDAEPTIKTWIGQLNSLRQAFAIPMTSADPKERFEQLGEKIAAFEKGMAVIKNIEQNYHTYVKKSLKDWFGSWGDLGDFETALTKTSTNYAKRLAAMTSEFKKLQTQVSNPVSALEEIRKLEAQITTLWAIPTYNEKEQEVLVWAQSGGTSGSVQEIRQNTAVLLKLKGDLRSKILPQAKRENRRATGKRASLNQPLSKRAVELPKAPTAVTPRPTRRRLPKSDTVHTMQEQINDLSTALDVNIGGRIKEDGIYGQNTANAVAYLVSVFSQVDSEKYPARANLAANLKSKGITTQMLANHQLMRSTARHMNRLTNSIAEVWAYHTGAKQQLSQREPGQPGQPTEPAVYTGPSKCDWNALNPTREQMLECFKTLQEDIGGERSYLYDYARENLNMSDTDIMDMLDRLFGRVPASNWSRSRIMKALGNRFTIL